MDPSAGRPSDYLFGALDSLPRSFTTARAYSLGLTRSQLRRLVASGQIEAFARGVYRRADAPLTDLDLVEVALRAPEATLCLESALERYDLTDRIPRAIEVALPRTARQPVTAAPVRWHRFDPATFAIGQLPLEVEPGLELNIYSAERTIVDVFRMRHLEGTDLAYEALRRWLRLHRGKPAALLEMASRFRNAEPALRAALEVLL